VHTVIHRRITEEWRGDPGTTTGENSCTEGEGEKGTGSGEGSWRLQDGVSLQRENR